METETIFRLILPILIVMFVKHRGYYSNKYKESDADNLKKRNEGLASRVANILGTIGITASIIYVLFPKWIGIVRTSIPLPVWSRWTGVVFALIGFALLQWAQYTLGKNWSDTPRMIKGQSLVTNGPYRWVRHPIYTAFIFILGSTLLISSNWLVGLGWIGMVVVEITSRIEFEESLMIEYFDNQYREYTKKTGRLFPRLTR